MHISERVLKLAQQFDPHAQLEAQTAGHEDQHAAFVYQDDFNTIIHVWGFDNSNTLNVSVRSGSHRAHISGIAHDGLLESMARQVLDDTEVAA